ncbi:transporter substrate-binding domain-containing protein [Saccharothrix deserti]|uniref:transporter substrate-binding domain-containing protein n=1 Tax=Saccharothrix deserti TaxID=2593674 RepID=UPI00131B5D52
MVFSDDIALTGYVAERPGMYDTVRFSAASINRYGIGLALDDKPLRDRINGILTEAPADRTWGQIYDRTLGVTPMTPVIPTVEPY